MTLDMEKYLRLFRDEALEYLARLHQLLQTVLEAEDPTHTLREMFRLAHSIKGMAASLGLEHTADLAHQLEDVFATLRSHPDLTPPLPPLRLALDLLERYVRGGETAVSEEERTAVQNQLKRLFETVSKTGAPPSVEPASGPLDTALPPEAESYDSTSADAEAPAAHTVEGQIQLESEVRLPAARWMVILRELEKYGSIEKTDPDRSEIQKGKAGTSLRVVLRSEHPPEKIARHITSLTDVRKAAFKHGTPATAPPALPTTDSLLPASIRVDLDAVDRYFQLAQAMFMQVQRIRNAALQWAGNRLHMEDEILLRDTETLARQLYLHLMNLRMLPLAILLNPLKRMVETLAPQMGKKAKLVTRGEDLTLDKAILEQMMDCFVHMVRNSLDHGLETPEERRRAHKPETGYISIHARQEGEWLQITVLDDGRGMDLERITQIAIEKGLVTPEIVRKMSPEEIVMLVTVPGFSTATEVTDISGRGVGMDVVRHRVEALGGTIRIETRRGRGTRIVLRLPSRLAIMDTLIVRYRKYHLALPMERIVRIESFSRDRMHYREQVPMWYIDEMIAPLVTIDRILGEPGRLRFESCYVMTIYHEQGIYALGVPHIVGEHRSVVQRLELPLSRLPLYSGITVSPDLEVIPLLDTEYLGRILTMGKASP